MDSDTIQVPQFACADPVRGVIQVNLFASNRGGALETHDWVWVIEHLLLHLALNHAARREGRDPLLWNIACDIVVERMLAMLGIGASFFPPDEAAQEWGNGLSSEETLYDELLRERRANHEIPRLVALSGTDRCDLLGLAGPGPFPFRKEWENRFVEGIHRAAQQVVAKRAQQEEYSMPGLSHWQPLAYAQRWVCNELPLLSALASEIRVIADARLCDGMNISVAAVNGFLGEMYFHTDCSLTKEEVLFVYVHELLHVALFHHMRCAGRDPYIWNLACDFVINAWLIEMGVGQLPKIGGLFDPRLQGMGVEEVYDLLVRDPRSCKKIRGFRGDLGDILMDAPLRRIYRDDVTTLDDVYRHCLRSGVDAWYATCRGLVPAGLLEEVKSLYTPPVSWDVDLARWMEKHVPLLHETRRTYSRASRRQASTPDIPRPARYIPQECEEAHTFGVVLDTSGSMDRELLGRALGAISSYAEARNVPAIRLVLCDAAPYDYGYVAPTDLRGVFPITGRGGTALQPAVSYLQSRSDFPASAPVMIITDGWCEEELIVAREHCFLMPRKSWKEGSVPLRTSAPVFRVLKETYND